MQLGSFQGEPICFSALADNDSITAYSAYAYLEYTLRFWGHKVTLWYTILLFSLCLVTPGIHVYNCPEVSTVLWFSELHEADHTLVTHRWFPKLAWLMMGLDNCEMSLLYRMNPVALFHTWGSLQIMTERKQNQMSLFVCATVPGLLWPSSWCLSRYQTIIVATLFNVGFWEQILETCNWNTEQPQTTAWNQLWLQLLKYKIKQLWPLQKLMHKIVWKKYVFSLLLWYWNIMPPPYLDVHTLMQCNETYQRC